LDSEALIASLHGESEFLLMGMKTELLKSLNLTEGNHPGLPVHPEDKIHFPSPFTAL
jgi:hypothetical protein